MPEFPPEVYALIEAAIAEDQTFSDPTTAAVVPPEVRGVGMLRAKAPGGARRRRRGPRGLPES